MNQNDFFSSYYNPSLLSSLCYNLYSNSKVAEISDSIAEIILRKNHTDKMCQETSITKENNPPMIETSSLSCYQNENSWSKNHYVNNKDKISPMKRTTTSTDYAGYGSIHANIDSQETITLGTLCLSDSNPFRTASFKLNKYTSSSSIPIMTYNTRETTIGSSTTEKYQLEQGRGFGAKNFYPTLPQDTNATRGSNKMHFCEKHMTSEDTAIGNQDAGNTVETDIQCCKLLEQNEQDKHGSHDLELGTSGGVNSILFQSFQQQDYQHAYSPYPPYIFIAPKKSPKINKQINNTSSLPTKEECTEPPKVSEDKTSSSYKSWVTARSVYTNEVYVRDLCNKLRSNPNLRGASARQYFNKPVPPYIPTKTIGISHQSGNDEQMESPKRFSWSRLSRRICGIKAPLKALPKQLQFSSKKNVLSFRKHESWKVFQSKAKQSNETPVPLDFKPISTLGSNSSATCQSSSEENKSITDQSSSHHFTQLWMFFHNKKERKPKNSTKSHFQKLRQFVHKFSRLENHGKSLQKEVQGKQKNPGVPQQKPLRGCLKVARNPNEEQELNRAKSCDTVDEYEKFKFEALYKKIRQQTEYSPKWYRLQQVLTYYDRVEEEIRSIPLEYSL